MVYQEALDHHIKECPYMRSAGLRDRQITEPMGEPRHKSM